MKITKLCPRCKKHLLVLRTNSQDGSQFLGCSSYPECKHTEGLPEALRLRLAGVPDMFDDPPPQQEQES